MKRSAATELSRCFWEARYRNPDAEPPENDIADTWKRVARAAAAIEKRPAFWSEAFLGLLRGFRFLPGGRILAGAGTTRNVTLANCFVMGLIEDSVEGIFRALADGALTIQQGGGIGYDFSTLRPRGSAARTTGRIASGPVAFLYVWDAMCAAMLSTHARRGAMMATLRCDHPDIEAFIDAGRGAERLRYFNRSVQISEQFMQAVMNDAEWPLVFPDPEGTIERTWTGKPQGIRCRIHRTLRARDLWRHLCDSAYAHAEPGVLFVDRINGENNLAYCEQLTATNPCAEQPLPPDGACGLGSINLTAFVRAPFTENAEIDAEGLRDATQLAVRFLDNCIEISRYPLAHQRERVLQSRRIGLGITGLGDALAMLGLRYDSEPARAMAARVMRILRDAAYMASVDLARERGPFPAFQRDAYLARPFIAALPNEVRTAIAHHGIRNSHLLSIAPAGSISLLAENVSSGIEPISGIETLRRVQAADGSARNFQVTDYAYAAWRASIGSQVAMPAAFVEAEAIAARDHLLMQAAVTPFVDGSIAKVISLPRDFPQTGVAEIFEAAHVLGLKGCTVFHAGGRLAELWRADWLEAAAEYGCTTGRASD